MADLTDPAAALLRDVPHDYNENGERVMLETPVLTALSRALDPALAERVGEVVEGVTPDWEMDTTGVYDRVLYAGGIVCVVHSTEADARFIAWCREGVPALLAQNAALRAERDEYQRLAAAGELAAKECRIWQRQAEAAEAREERLRGASIEAYYVTQVEWSRETFGPALRTKGIIDHITKELREIAADPHDLSEWIDVVILAMDGFWRHGGKPEDLMPALLAKQAKNMARTWPDWRSMSEDAAIEHDRSKDAALTETATTEERT